MRFGQLNLVILTDEQKFNRWSSVTASLILRAPVTHDEAVAAFRAEGLGGDYEEEQKGSVGVLIIDPFEV